MKLIWGIRIISGPLPKFTLMLMRIWIKTYEKLYISFSANPGDLSASFIVLMARRSSHRSKDLGMATKFTLLRGRYTYDSGGFFRTFLEDELLVFKNRQVWIIFNFLSKLPCNLTGVFGILLVWLEEGYETDQTADWALKILVCWSWWIHCMLGCLSWHQLQLLETETRSNWRLWLHPRWGRTSRVMRLFTTLPLQA